MHDDDYQVQQGRHELAKWDELMHTHHELGFRRFVGRGLRYIVERDGQWLCLAGWQTVGESSGYSRINGRYGERHDCRKRLLMRPLRRDAKRLLCWGGELALTIAELYKSRWQVELFFICRMQHSSSSGSSSICASNRFMGCLKTQSRVSYGLRFRFTFCVPSSRND